jgi:hypothetical protein
MRKVCCEMAAAAAKRCTEEGVNQWASRRHTAFRTTVLRDEMLTKRCTEEGVNQWASRRLVRFAQQGIGLRI